MRHQGSRLRATVGAVVLSVLALLVPAAASGPAAAVGRAAAAPGVIPAPVRWTGQEGTLRLA
ncbi:hypothetical protein, partial [Streptomyces botrytidirepellens]|uniref:hypothetical protein n=1 Tax=Streptomyces botrytidirepellens TaxID=2486417 RepID=UPI00160C6FFE